MRERSTLPNRWGMQAWEHWARHLPSRYAAIPHPAAYFTQLGDEIAEQIDQTAITLVDRAPSENQDETYLHRTDRLRAARTAAEELVMTDLVWSQSEQDQSEPASDEMGAWVGADRAMGPWTPLFDGGQPEPD